LATSIIEILFVEAAVVVSTFFIIEGVLLVPKADTIRPFNGVLVALLWISKVFLSRRIFYVPTIEDEGLCW
jgi:hypothetical protein